LVESFAELFPNDDRTDREPGSGLPDLGLGRFVCENVSESRSMFSQGNLIGPINFDASRRSLPDRLLFGSGAKNFRNSSAGKPEDAYQVSIPPLRIFCWNYAAQPGQLLKNDRSPTGVIDRKDGGLV
jgi:hypothetical protein